jgi:glycerophosphoryl diester phosphodiesterase
VLAAGFKRIGHGGASALAPANTLAGFDAAVEVGIDVVEFDVRPWRGELVLAHTPVDARRGGCVRLRDALAHLSGRRFRDVGLNVDIKRTGYERALLSELRDASLLDRTILSSQVALIVDRIRAADPSAVTGISVGGVAARALRRWRDWRLHVLDGLATGRWNALMAQHRLVDLALLEAVGDRGGLLYAWTVNERESIDALRVLGVHGVATADPRLFG